MPSDASRPIELRSDNCAGVSPEVLAALSAANTGTALAYGGDDWSARLREQVAELFELPDVRVFPVASGTAANALALSAMTKPWGAVICHESAHITKNEAGATTMFSGGAVMHGLPGDHHLLHPSDVAAVLASTGWGDPHESQPSVLSLTCPSDFGSVYQPEDVAAVVAAVAPHRLRVHLDGARFANAVAALGCSPADLSWRVGVEVLSLGAIKNGGMSCDAIVCFAGDVADQLVFRVKRAGHVASKMRYQAAQLEAYLHEGGWLGRAAHANAMMAKLVAGARRLGVEIVNRPDANMMFASLPDGMSSRLAESGVLFYDIAPQMARFVTSWQTTEADIEGVLTRLAAALGV
jgi:threonine aldolase